jgi:3-isopropylmalate dehydrogenase
MNKTIVVLPGDGIGPEVVNQALKVMHKINRRFGHDFTISEGLIGACSIDECGVPLSDEVVDSCKAADAVLLGAIGDPKYDNDPTAKFRPEQGLLRLRKELGLHSNIRPIATYDAVQHCSPLKKERVNGVDLLIYRELTGGLYFGEKYLSEDGSVAFDGCSYSIEEITLVAKNSFKAANERRRILTLVDKANVLETSRLWRKVIQKMSASYPDVTVNYMYVDNAAMQLMLDPAQFDVILTENLFGDILSDLAGVITGSIGLLPSASYGTETAVFEPIHGSYPQAAGKDIANPMGTILSLAMMYTYFGLAEEAALIQKAVNWAIEHAICTQDICLDNYLWCSRVGDLISYYVEDETSVNHLTCNKLSEVII